MQLTLFEYLDPCRSSPSPSSLLINHSPRTSSPRVPYEVPSVFQNLDLILCYFSRETSRFTLARLRPSPPCLWQCNCSGQNPRGSSGLRRELPLGTRLLLLLLLVAQRPVVFRRANTPPKALVVGGPSPSRPKLRRANLRVEFLLLPTSLLQTTPCQRCR